MKEKQTEFLLPNMSQHFPGGLTWLRKDEFGVSANINSALLERGGMTGTAYESAGNRQGRALQVTSGQARCSAGAPGCGLLLRLAAALHCSTGAKAQRAMAQDTKNPPKT